MNVAISGIGLVSPFGTDVAETWRRISAGERAPLSELTSSLSSRTFPYLAVPRESVREYERHPRLRRSSEISHYAAIAGMKALQDAGIDPKTSRIGVVFGISSGGVRYTTRFYHDVITTGASTASPLLFPETVYNAPASHLAALLGLDGMTYTLVGDSMIGLSALSFGADLVATGQLDHCVVVASEEAEWILCEAFRRSRFFTIAAETKPFGGPGNRGTVFSEGAAAVVLSQSGSIEIAAVHRGIPYFKNTAAETALRTVLSDLGDTPEVVLTGANGTRLDDAEASALQAVWPGAKMIAGKAALGESVGAGALQQTVLAAQLLRENVCQRAGISAIGYNTLAAGAILQKRVQPR
ncbi:MAG: beta-ketoacyl synthase N-terminal-like domain-containing protein [Chthoniobacterales bacterium]